MILNLTFMHDSLREPIGDKRPDCSPLKINQTPLARLRVPPSLPACLPAPGAKRRRVLVLVQAPRMEPEGVLGSDMGAQWTSLNFAPGAPEEL